MKISTDQPKTKLSEDRYGYAKFASAISRIVTSNDFEDGYILGVNGEWGAGKTSCVNFIKEYIKEYNKNVNESNAINIIDFNPWLSNGRDDIISEFIKVLRDGFLDTAVKKNAIKGVEVATDAIVDNIDRIAELFTQIAYQTLPAVVRATTGFDFGLKAALGFGKKTVEKAVDKYKSDKSAQASFEELKKLLAKKKNRIAVFIDDIDRMNKDDTNAIVQAIKSIGALPYIFYVVAYDKNVVVSAIDGEETTKTKYIDKIVQQEVNLPKIAPKKLVNEFIKNIEEIEIKNKHKWNLMQKYTLRHWFKTPRDVSRFSNSVNFYHFQFNGDINFYDLIVMLGLREFCPKIHAWIIQNYKLLIEERKSQPSEGMLRRYEEFSKLLLEEPTSGYLVAKIFPNNSKFFHKREEAKADALDKKSISFGKNLHHYLNFGGYEPYISYQETASLIDVSLSVDEYQEMIGVWLGNRDLERGDYLIGQHLDELRENVRNMNIKIPVRFVDALLAEMGGHLKSEIMASNFISTDLDKVTSFLLDGCYDGIFDGNINDIFDALSECGDVNILINFFFSLHEGSSPIQREFCISRDVRFPGKNGFDGFDQFKSGFIRVVLDAYEDGFVFFEPQKFIAIFSELAGSQNEILRRYINFGAGHFYSFLLSMTSSTTLGLSHPPKIDYSKVYIDLDEELLVSTARFYYDKEELLKYKKLLLLASHEAFYKNRI